MILHDFNSLQYSYNIQDCQEFLCRCYVYFDFVTKMLKIYKQFIGEFYMQVSTKAFSAKILQLSDSHVTAL